MDVALLQGSLQGATLEAHKCTLGRSWRSSAALSQGLSQLTRVAAAGQLLWISCQGVCTGSHNLWQHLYP